MKKKFLIRTLWFLLLLILINVVLDQLYKNYVAHNILNNKKDRDFTNYNETLQYLSMGNSHNVVNTYILDNTYNYNSPAENYVQTYYKLRSIIEEKNKKPQNLLLFIDMSSFSPRAGKYFEHNSYWIKYIDYFELARIKGDKNILNKWVEGKFFSYAGGYREIMLTFVYLIKIGKLDLHNGYRSPRNYNNFAYEKPEDMGGFSVEENYDWSGARRVDKSEEKRRARYKSDIYFSMKGYFDPTLAIYFNKILELCHEHGIKVILIRVPVTKAYWEYVSSKIPVDSLYDKIEGIYNRYPNVKKVLDYHDVFFLRPELFFDADHLNPEGAELFTKRLKEDLAVE
ncbi:MAG: hypothetical protein U5Q03_16950 [Bacteroidota bacterium]|nr:hypothetical protein [Bacteroidota bacterium]